MATIDTPDGQLYYEIRGNGPLLLVSGSPMAAAAFAPLADALASHYTVITHDPRGIAVSSLDDPDGPSDPDRRADDLIVLLDSLDADSVDMFGSSGGAVTGLALVAKYPGRVRTLIAHEPPLLELLPDAEEWRASIDDIVSTFRERGAGAAWYEFMVSAGFVQPGDGAQPATDEAPPAEAAAHAPSPQEEADNRRFFEHDLRGTTRYLPELAGLVSGPTRIVVGVGSDSGRLNTYQTSVKLATLLAEPPVEFPGDHAGFLGQPQKFAEVIRDVLVADPAIN